MKKSIIISIVFILGVVLIFGFFIEKSVFNGSPKDRVAEILNKEIDVSKSKFTSEETQMISARIKDQGEALVAKDLISVEEVVGLAREYRDIKDYSKALELFMVADTMNPTDLSYLIDKGNIYLDLQQWEMARQVFEPMKITWPIYQSYLGLAKAYQNIEGTPEYVVDQVYEDSLFRSRGTFEVLEAYAQWLEKTDRGDKAIQYYEMMNEMLPQSQLDQKIKELKEKHKVQ